jgi:hypothetical protein
MAIFKIIATILDFFLSLFKFKNTSDMKQAQKGQDNANQCDKTAEAIQKKDTNEIRNQLSE